MPEKFTNLEIAVLLLVLLDARSTAIRKEDKDFEVVLKTIIDKVQDGR